MWSAVVGGWTSADRQTQIGSCSFDAVRAYTCTVVQNGWWRKLIEVLTMKMVVSDGWYYLSSHQWLWNGSEGSGSDF